MELPSKIVDAAGNTLYDLFTPDGHLEIRCEEAAIAVLKASGVPQMLTCVDALRGMLRAIHDDRLGGSVWAIMDEQSVAEKAIAAFDEGLR